MNNNSGNRVFKVYVDFDGTITKQDIGEQMFLKFGNPEEAINIVDRWIKKEITSRDSLRLLCNTVQDFSANAFEEFLNQIEIDESFYGFTDVCKSNDIDIFVVSDGLDYYIKMFLEKFNLKDLKVFSNKLVIDENMKLTPQFPHTDEECDLCANCKRNHIINTSSDDEYTIYIGDGYSDTCPAQHVDFIFAKNSLLKFCESNRISYYPFKTFDDIIKRLNELLKKKNLKKRHQAELKRKEVYHLG